jgi:hypothetical protein
MQVGFINVLTRLLETYSDRKEVVTSSGGTWKWVFMVTWGGAFTEAADGR